MAESHYGSRPVLPDATSDPSQTSRDRPTVALALGALAADARLTTRAGTLVGWALRDATGTGGGEGLIAEVDASAAGAAAAIAAALPAAAGKTTYITGFEITGGGAAAASVITVTVTGILGGTKSYKLAVPAGAAVGVAPLTVEFSRPIPASGLNVAIAVNVPSFGAGNTDAAVTAHGFQAAGAPGLVASFVADLFDGGDATGTPIGSISIGPDGESVRVLGREGPYFRVGLFIHVIQGAAQGAIWAKI